MKYHKLQIYFFTAIFLIVLALSIIIFIPYLGPIVLALIFAIIFEPLHKIFLNFFRKYIKWRKGHVAEVFAAVMTLIVFLLILLGPLFLVGFQVASEIKSLYAKIAGGGSFAFLNQITGYIESQVAVYIPNFSLNLSAYSEQVLRWVTGNTNAFFQGVGSFVLGIFLCLLAFYYFLKDGHMLKNFFLKTSPLPDEDDKKVLFKMKNAVNSIIRGSLAVAVIQGILTGIGFAIFGIPNPTLWGSVAAISALIPTLGTTLVLVPGIFYLFFIGETSFAVGLLIWGVVAVGLIDNFLGPFLMKQGTPIHPFLILLSVLGGLSFFGLLGFLIGPLVISLLYALFDIYSEIIKPIKQRG